MTLRNLECPRFNFFESLAHVRQFRIRHGRGLEISVRLLGCLDRGPLIYVLRQSHEGTSCGEWSLRGCTREACHRPPCNGRRLRGPSNERNSQCLNLNRTRCPPSDGWACDGSDIHAVSLSSPSTGSYRPGDGHTSRGSPRPSTGRLDRWLIRRVRCSEQIDGLKERSEETSVGE